MGHEFAGEIIEVGSAAKSLWKAGDRVAGFPYICCGDSSPCTNFKGGAAVCAKGLSIGLGSSPGAYAEYVRIGASGAFRLPDSVSFREGALVEPLAVGLHAVDMAKMEHGATVLVIGAGPVGLAVMLWAKFLGARHVIVSERAEVRRAMAAKFGATDAIDPSQPLTPQVEKIAGKGADIIFECVGAPGMIGAAMMEAPRHARIVRPPGDVPATRHDHADHRHHERDQPAIRARLPSRRFRFRHRHDRDGSHRRQPHDHRTSSRSTSNLPAAFEALRKPSHQCKVMLEN